MAEAILSLNLNTFLVEALLERLLKAEALSEVALSESFLDCEKSTLHGFMWTLNELLNEARLLNEQLVDRTIKEKGV